jgi:hypothetical protein
MTFGGRRAAGLGIIPAAFLVHNVEEAVMIPPMLPVVQAALRGVVGPWVTLPSAGQYMAVLVILTLAVFALWLSALRHDGLAYGLVVFQATMALNVLNHVGGAVLLRGYAPGIVTAVLVEAVTSVVVFWHVRQAGWMSRRQWRWAAIWAVVLHGPVFYGLGLLALWG